MVRSLSSGVPQCSKFGWLTLTFEGRYVTPKLIFCSCGSYFRDFYPRSYDVAFFFLLSSFDSPIFPLAALFRNSFCLFLFSLLKSLGCSITVFPPILSPSIKIFLFLHYPADRTFSFASTVEFRSPFFAPAWSFPQSWFSAFEEFLVESPPPPLPLTVVHISRFKVHFFSTFKASCIGPPSLYACIFSFDVGSARKFFAAFRTRPRPPPPTHTTDAHTSPSSRGLARCLFPATAPSLAAQCSSIFIGIPVKHRYFLYFFSRFSLGPG